MTLTKGPASSGWISGIGFAIAKTMGSRRMALMSFRPTTPGPLRPMNTSASTSASPAVPRSRFGFVCWANHSFMESEAAWRRDVFEIDPAEDGRDGLHDGDDLVHVFGGQAEGEGVDSGELPEDERLALHDGLGPFGPDVAEAEHGGAVGHDRHAVLLDGERIRLLGILVDGHADAGHTRCVRHREIVAGLDRDLAPHLDLPAEVHPERAVGDIDDAGTRHGPDLLHDLLGVAFIARLEAEIACDGRFADFDEIDGADVTARLADGRRHLAQHSWLVLDLEAHGHAITRARSVDHYSSRTG